MGIELNQYRASIGSFNSISSNHSPGQERNNPTERKLSYKIIPLILVVFIPIIIGSYAAFNNCDEYQYKTETNLQEADLSGLVTADYSTSFLIQNFLNVLAASSFSMISNFQSRYTNGNRRTQGIKICHWNKGGSHLHNKMAEIRQIVSGIHPHILGVSEANFLPLHDQAQVQITDYNLHLPLTLSNKNNKYCRIVTYTHKSLVAKLRPDLMSDTCSSIWLEVGMPRHKKFLVCQAYREWQLLNQGPDNSSLAVPEQLARWTELLDQWDRALSTGMEVHTLGDMNINHLNWTDQSLPSSNQTSRLRPLISALFTRILPRGVTQCVRQATRHWPNQTSTGLDHYYTNRPDKITNVHCQHNGGSDHMVIFATRYSKSIKSHQSYVRKRSYKTFDPDQFIAAIQQTSWLEVYLCTDVEQAVTLLSSKIINILDMMAPMKTVQIRTNYNPWISPETKQLMKDRDDNQKLAAETHDPEIWRKYKNLRNRVTSRLKSEENNWKRYKLTECGRDSSKSWKTVKGILNWNSPGSPTQLFHNGHLYTKPQDIASTQNEFSLSKVELIRQNLPPPISNPLTKLRSLMVGRSCSFKLAEVHPEEVEKIISKLKNSSSFGLDLIDTKVIKLIKQEIVPSLTHVINLSISSKIFPNFWKSAKIIPLHKKEDILNPKNYRPVAILPIFSKILERSVFNQINKYLSENNLLHPNHHAYRRNRNTTTALLQMHDTWVGAVEDGELSGVCLLDMSAAFDIVDHEILLNKLELYGFDSDSLGWIQSYLSDRRQCVSISGSLSKLLPVPTGVPQGSILGPLFYTLFTNELPEVIHEHHHQVDDGAAGHWPRYNLDCKTCGNVCCYADDTTYSCSDTDPQALSEQLTAKYKLLSEFLVSNRLKLNDDKTHLMVLTTSQTRRRVGGFPDVVIRTPEADIRTTPVEKLLGAWIHQDLKWSEHLQENDESLVRALSTRLSAIKMVCKVATFQTRKMIADGLFMSKLSYLISVWGGCEGYIVRILQVIQNKVARLVTKKPWTTPVKDLLLACGWLSVKQLAMYHTVVLVFKVLRTGTPSYISSMFSTEYRRMTRQALQGIIKPSNGVARFEIASKSFRFRAVHNYNLLPVSIKEASNLIQFKKMTKTWIMENVPLA